MSEQSTNANLKNMFCYIPFVAFVLFFLEKNKSPELLKNIKYGAGLFVVYILLDMVLRLFELSSILFVIYLIASIYLGYKAYIGDDIELEGMDVIEDKIKAGFKVK